jgi:C4-dicarboxylate-specific signal transduction histidine kinase
MDVIGFWLREGDKRIYLAIAILIPCIALLDWSVGNRVSLGVLYILPMMVGAMVLDGLGTALLAAVCAFLRAWFDTPASGLEVSLRFLFALLAYFVSGMFVRALVRNRRLVVEHLTRIEREQELRREAEEQLRVLVQSSPAAILTLDQRGIILGCNNATNELLMIPEEIPLNGKSISPYLPLLSDALRLDSTRAGFRTASQCQGRRENGDLFRAHTWFSSYNAAEGKRLAAIVVDSSEEMREREESNLALLRESSRVVASAVSHEIKTLCRALSLVSSNLRNEPGMSGNADFEGLLNLIGALEKIAFLDLHSRVKEKWEHVSLKEVLDNLRIVIEADWRESSGVIHWNFAEPLPLVLADAHGLLQVLLTLAENSYRAVQESRTRELTISVCASQHTAAIKVGDSGPGVAAPNHLFEPFQAGASGTGMGLFVARAAMRSYGGDLRYEPQERGALFLIDLQICHPKPVYELQRN